MTFLFVSMLALLLAFVVFKADHVASPMMDAVDPAQAAAATSCNQPTIGRCRPQFCDAGCTTLQNPYCNEASGWCGNTDAHKNAQANTKYDYGTCVPTPGRCGPFFCNGMCTNWQLPFCNEATGWCGSTSAHANAQPSTKFDYGSSTCTTIQGRCGPSYCHGMCTDDAKPWCNEAIGWCGNTGGFGINSAGKLSKYNKACGHTSSDTMCHTYTFMACVIELEATRASTGACGQDCTFGDCQQSKPPPVVTRKQSLICSGVSLTVDSAGSLYPREACVLGP
eukprot:g6384.t1